MYKDKVLFERVDWFDVMLREVQLWTIGGVVVVGEDIWGNRGWGREGTLGTCLN